MAANMPVSSAKMVRVVSASSSWRSRVASHAGLRSASSPAASPVETATKAATVPEDHEHQRRRAESDPVATS